VGFEAAMKRSKRVSSLDKANVLASSLLWRTVVNEVSKDYPEVEVTHYLIDNASMEVIKDPSKFDVIISSNIFGDIIADELSQITGTAGILASAELGKNGPGIFTPNQLHNLDESNVGKDAANPIGMILAAALMLRYSLGLEVEALRMENAVDQVLKENFATSDIFCEGKKLIGAEEMTTRIINYI
jgi:3-isopropylmalate dehydrogenase